MSKSPYLPTWKRYEKDANDQTNATKALKASDAFIAEREKELRTSARARAWEKTRKESIAKQKPQYVKERIKEDAEELLRPYTDLKKGGTYSDMIKPMPGFVLIEVDTQEEKTASGIILPVKKEPTTGTVIAIGDKVLVGEHLIDCPFKVGQKVLFKKYAGAAGTAGLELNLEGKDYRLMRWSSDSTQSDILGVFE